MSDVMTLSRDLGMRGRVTRVGWHIPDNMSEEEWQEAGKQLRQIDGSLMWCIGDWWNYAEHRYGDRKAIVTAEDWDGPSYGTCKNAGSVCEKFPLIEDEDERSRRRDLLGFTHHVEVAALPAKEADDLLLWAERYKKSTRELRAAVRNLQMNSSSISPEEKVGLAIKSASQDYRDDKARRGEEADEREERAAVRSTLDNMFDIADEPRAARHYDDKNVEYDVPMGKRISNDWTDIVQGVSLLKIAADKSIEDIATQTPLESVALEIREAQTAMWALERWISSLQEMQNG